MYLNRLKELAINMFRWYNLPSTVDARFLELTLANDGMAVFFRDDVMGFLTLQVKIGGPLDVYRNPTIRTAYATNGYNNDLTNQDSVIIYNNYTRTNILNDLEMYARRLYEIERAIDVNVRNQKTPKIVLCSENQRLVLKNLFKQYEGNEPFIYGDKNLDITQLKSIDITTPYVSDKLQILKRQIWNEALTYLGVDNSNTEKKERLVTDEIISNLGGVEAMRLTRLNARKDAVERINETFNLDISVEFGVPSLNNLSPDEEVAEDE